MTSPASAAAPANTAQRLHRLYLARFAFAAIWAASLATSASTLGAFTIALLVLYPAFDVAAAIIDARSAPQTTTSSAGLYTNIAISTLAAIGLAIAGFDGIPTVLRTWGIWAIAAGLVQLAVGVSRLRLGGQWAMIASGGLSVIVGSAFIASASSATSMTSIAGYAALGGVFFLISALRLRRSAP